MTPHVIQIMSGIADHHLRFQTSMTFALPLSLPLRNVFRPFPSSSRLSPTTAQIKCITTVYTESSSIRTQVRIQMRRRFMGVYCGRMRKGGSSNWRTRTFVSSGHCTQALVIDALGIDRAVVPEYAPPSRLAHLLDMSEMTGWKWMDPWRKRLGHRCRPLHSPVIFRARKHPVLTAQLTRTGLSQHPNQHSLLSRLSPRLFPIPLTPRSALSRSSHA